MDEFGLDSIEPLAQEILTRSERAMREAIQRIPDGTYVGETWSDGFADDEPIHIVCTVKVTGSDIVVDYAGSSAARGVWHQRRAELHHRRTRPSASRRRSVPTFPTTRARSVR